MFSGIMNIHYSHISYCVLYSISYVMTRILMTGLAHQATMMDQLNLLQSMQMKLVATAGSVNIGGIKSGKEWGKK